MSPTWASVTATKGCALSSASGPDPNTCTWCLRPGPDSHNANASPALRAPFDDYHAEAEEFIDAGESVIVRVRQGGRGSVSAVGVEMPAHRQLYRLRAGRAVRVETYREETEALEAARRRRP